MSDRSNSGGVNIPPALKTAGVAAASSAAVVAVRHALARNAAQKGDEQPKSDEPLAVAVDAAWGAARDALRPSLEEAAGAAGRYAGEHLPETFLEVVVPRFVEGFHEARERRDADADEAALERDDSEDGGDEDE
jgi:gamma-glutamyl:cysteine ligase YbdK (ATP-grasp superfamily)